jgi:PTS system nitrogen regulatory IIA component
MGPEPDRLLTVKEAAAILGVRPGTVYLWAERGELPSYKIGSLRRFRLADLEAFIESCRQAPEQPPPWWPRPAGRATLGGRS